MGLEAPRPRGAGMRNSDPLSSPIAKDKLSNYRDFSAVKEQNCSLGTVEGLPPASPWVKDSHSSSFLSRAGVEKRLSGVSCPHASKGRIIIGSIDLG
jgi:hypothetical protein